MKTIIIYDVKKEDIIFCVVNGDYSHLDGYYLDGHDDLYRKEKIELHELIYDYDNSYNYTMLNTFPVELVQSTKGIKVIVCGFFE
jgi:hypothetical protein